MFEFLLRKTGRVVLTTFLAVSFVFVILRLSGDPTLHLLGADADPASRESLARYLGIDRPLITQYLSYILNIFNGDLGVSFRDGRPALTSVFERIPNTLLLGGISFVVAMSLGTVLGVIAALNRNSWLDRALVAFAISGYAMPNFFFGILLILTLSLQLGWLPSAGMGSPQHLIMPVATLSLSWVGVLSRFVRGSVVEALTQPHVLAARARGLSGWTVLFGHVIRNAMVPTVVISGFVIGAILGGAVITETVFAWPGVGRLLVTSVTSRDLPVVQAILILLVVVMTMTNMIVDVIVALLDPRTKGA